MEKIRNMWGKITGKDHRANQGVSDQDLKDQLNHISRRLNLERDNFEREITQLIADIEDNENPE